MEEQEKAVSFWLANKNTVWALVLVVFGVAGGNVDRLYESLPDVYGVSTIKEDLNVIDSKLKNINDDLLSLNKDIDLLRERSLEFEKVVDLLNQQKGSSN